MHIVHSLRLSFALFSTLDIRVYFIAISGGQENVSGIKATHVDRAFLLNCFVLSNSAQPKLKKTANLYAACFMLTSRRSWNEFLSKRVEFSSE